MVDAHINIGGFEWVENTSQSNKNFIKNCNEDTNEGYFFEADVQCFRKLHEPYNDLPISPERIKAEKTEKFLANLSNKK